MKTYISIGSTPGDEPCQQVPYTDRGLARKECQAFIEAIQRKVGQPPEGASLGIKSFTHDFGSYMEVVCFFDDTNAEALDYAIRCERDAPQHWSDVGMTPPTTEPPVIHVPCND